MVRARVWADKREEQKDKDKEWRVYRKIRTRAFISCPIGVTSSDGGIVCLRIKEMPLILNKYDVAREKGMEEETGSRVGAG